MNATLQQRVDALAVAIRHPEARGMRFVITGHTLEQAENARRSLLDRFGRLLDPEGPVPLPEEWLSVQTEPKDQEDETSTVSVNEIRTTVNHVLHFIDKCIVTQINLIS